MELFSVDLEKIAYAAVPVVIGVIVAGYLLGMLGGSGGVLAGAQSGYTGQ